MIFTLTALLSASTVLGGELNRPVITYPDDWRLGNDLIAALPSRTVCTKKWDGNRANKIPQGCADMAKRQDLDLKDVTVYDVVYDDSDIVYALCHHKDAPMSAEKLIDWYGKAPGFLRTNARHVIAMPGDGASGLAAGDNVAYLTDIGMQGFIHELGHQLDTWCAFPGKEYSNSQCHDTDVWQEAFNTDTVAVGDYANTNHAENFAELTVHAMYEWHVKGGIDKLEGTVDGQPAKPMYKSEIDLIMKHCAKELAGQDHVRAEDGYKEYPVIDK